ncbi:conserved hypothetical protein [Leishmania braziliensis MHOM/BR/75/M2904]|uniref:Leucine-rich repeat protein n=2 Tax=Leishmania braziliensis TaxID=5660 RepID=A4HI02_LEIBR|nr:conserved hypothetical protein [Leishmania braziliensis MHOM/BR/75/M2904]CAJ2476975.1 unnamed protein product [Leishmania braziliensis]CAM40208.2 conserved hypothetical protein [Leishmania braziliensis MHOM/BR/75/M2904]SYZ67868.1 hypothetical_protein [Leishmania braziliensis MHOM/BR/75/M2904]
MCANTSASVHVPTVCDLMREQPRSIGTFASTELEDVYNYSAYMSALGHATTPSSATRSLADFLNDILFSYTGVRSWSAFLHIQQEGAALRRQLGDGATFAHEAVHPVLSPVLKQWAETLRAQQAARVRAIGADDSPHTTIVARAAAPRGGTATGKPPFKSQLSASDATAAVTTMLNRNAAKHDSFLTASAPDDLNSSSSLMERELVVANACARLTAEEDGVLPLWTDLNPTQRCDPLALQCLRTAVGAYFLVLLRLVDIAESLADHWGLLSPKERKKLHRAMTSEKAAHVPADFLFSIFTELNASEGRLSNAVADLCKCTRLEVVRLNSNAGLTELNVLPPHCRVVIVCGCSLDCFLEATRPSPPLPPSATPPAVYASLTTLGLAYNRLRHLHFVQQLPSLRVLNMSFNYVSDLEAAVQDVAAQGSLTEVTLQGNPISLLDVYRTLVVRSCVHLDSLDGVAVTGEERALGRPTLDDGDAAAEHSPGRPVLDSFPASAATLPSIRGRHRLSVSTSPAQSSQLHNSLRRGCSTLGVPQLSTLYSVVTTEASRQPVSDEVLRTTVAAELGLVTVKGLSSLQPVPQSCAADSLLPSSDFLLELAGVDKSVQALESSDGRATPTQVGSLLTSPLSSSIFSLQASGSRKGRHHSGTAGDSGGRSASTNSNSAGGKRALTPLYEVSSRVTVEGCWGDSSVSRSGAPHGYTDCVRVAVEVCLESPVPLSTHHTGRHTGAPGAPPLRVSSAALGKQRRTGGVAAAANGATSPPPILDPYIPARVAAGAGGGGGATCLVSFPLTEVLVCALQQPVVLRVIVEDTFRYSEAEVALCAQLDAAASNAARGGPASRNSATMRPAPGELPSHAALSSLSSPQEAPPSGTPSHRNSEDAEEESVMHLRCELGVITLDPRGLFSTAVGGDSATSTVAPCCPTPLPSCRVLYVHDAALEKDAHALKSVEREVQQRQCRLREALASYSHMHRQYREASRKGLESPEGLSSALLAGVGKDSAATGMALPQSNKRRVSVAATAPPSSVSILSTPSTKSLARSRRTSSAAPPASASQLQGLYAGLKAQQLLVAQRAVRVLALRTRLAELHGASLSVSARFCVGRGATPPPSTVADAELDALRHCQETPAVRKSRQQGTKGSRR